MRRVRRVTRTGARAADQVRNTGEEGGGGRPEQDMKREHDHAWEMSLGNDRQA